MYYFSLNDTEQNSRKHKETLAAAIFQEIVKLVIGNTCLKLSTRTTIFVISMIKKRQAVATLRHLNNQM